MLLYSENTEISDRHKWNIKWYSNKRIILDSSDIYAFKNRMTIKNSITAWDGGTIFNYNTGKLEAGAYGGWFREWSRQHTYYKYVDKTWYGKPKRKRQGKVLITPKITPQIPWLYFNK